MTSEKILPKQIYLRPINEMDLNLLLKLRNDYRNSFMNSKYIDYQEHLRWFYDQYSSDNHDTIYTIYDLDERVKIGFIALTLRQANTGVVGRVMIDPRGRGYGSAALKKIIELAKDIYNLDYLEAEVKPGNMLSILLFQKFNFIPVSASNISTIFRLDLQQ